MARVRTSRRKASAIVAAVTRDVDFPHLWRQLRAVGWKAKRPSGLATEWSYSTPDGSNVFVGESAVVAHALTSGLLNESVEDESVADESVEDEIVADKSVEEEFVIDASDDDASTPQIDTDTVLIQRTVDALFALPSEDEGRVELSQEAPTRALGLSQSALQVGESQREVAATLQQLSGASGLESDDDEPVQAPASTRLPMKKDVNFVAENENSSDYESFSSGESDSEVVEDDDQEPECDRDNVDDDVVSDSDAVLIDEAFIASLMIGAGDRDKRCIKQREAALRSMQWTASSSTFELGTEAYEGMNNEDAHPVTELRQACDSPLLTFLYFMPKSLWVAINMETNRYGIQQIDRRAQAIQAKQRERQRETVKQIRRRLKSKKAYETHEILHVVGLLVARMLCPQQRRFAAHWSMVEDGAVPAGNFGRYMSRNRCHDILRDLHFVDNETDRTSDKLWKLRPIVDKLQQRFLTGWTLPAVFSFDEGVLPSTSRRNTTRMFMPDKPHRYGSKMFMTCDSRTAYCHRCVFVVVFYVVTSGMESFADDGMS
jgi:hypothetical protein